MDYLSLSLLWVFYICSAASKTSFNMHKLEWESNATVLANNWGLMRPHGMGYSEKGANVYLRVLKHDENMHTLTDNGKLQRC